MQFSITSSKIDRKWILYGWYTLGDIQGSEWLIPVVSTLFLKRNATLISRFFWLHFFFSVRRFYGKNRSCCSIVALHYLFTNTLRKGFPDYIFLSVITCNIFSCCLWQIVLKGYIDCIRNLSVMGSAD